MKKRNIYLFIVLSIILYSFVFPNQNNIAQALQDGILSGIIDLNNLDNYANQPVPNYITKDNTTPGNAITDAGATLGRVLFYDKNLSSNNTIACASCHQQEFAFSDTSMVSQGVNGTTGRHSMRLINTRFGEETKFFWDERAPTLEAQTTRPIQDHLEMGFSGMQGDPDLDSLLRKMQKIDYYNTLFQFVYGDSVITEQRMQLAMAQFIRSIQSFDAKYDIGRALVANDTMPFPNFTAQENAGKALFMTPPVLNNMGVRVSGGAGCNQCHRAPEFDIDPNSLNNSVVNRIGQPGIDTTIFRSPTMRDILKPNGLLNGPLMHTGNFGSIAAVVNRYDSIIALPQNTSLDPRLMTSTGMGQHLMLTPQERNNIRRFIQTLAGNNVYFDAKWSDPFSGGQLTVIPLMNTNTEEVAQVRFEIYPNPTYDFITIEVEDRTDISYRIFDSSGRMVQQDNLNVFSQGQISLEHLKTGIYFLQIRDEKGELLKTEKIVKL